MRFMHPTAAVILSLFDGRRTFNEVVHLWSELSGKSIGSSHEEVTALFNFYTSGERGKDQILVHSAGLSAHVIPNYDPTEFIVPFETVNLVERRLRIPYVVHFLPTLYCPSRCIYCYAKRRGRPETKLLPVERLVEIFRELKSLGVESIQISGGEIFSRTDIFEILQAIIDSGLLPDIPTKAAISYAMAVRLRDLGINLIQFSIDSAEPETMNHMVGLRSYSYRAFASLQNLRRAGLSVRVNTVLTPINIEGVPLLLQYLGELGNVNRVTLSPYGRSIFRHSDELFVTDNSLRVLKEQVELRRETYPHMRITVGSNGSPEPTSQEERKLNWARRAFCTADRDGFVILPDGRVTVCEELYDHPAFIIGDLNRQMVMEMWNSYDAWALLTPDQALVADGPCKDCEDFVECHRFRGRCWRDVIKSYGWNKHYWPDPRCPKAPPGARLG